MWHVCSTELSETKTRYQLRYDRKPVAVMDVLEAMVSSPEFRLFFNSVLAESVWAAYRWETPPVSDSSISSPFEFVLINSEELERPPDRTSFRDHFGDQPVAVFPNLAGDAQLVVPCAIDDHCSYAHLAAFARTAPPEQIHRLWQAVGATMLTRLAEQPLWLSTAGMGIAWLHVRLDSRPKYYAHLEYVAAD